METRYLAGAVTVTVPEPVKPVPDKLVVATPEPLTLTLPTETDVGDANNVGNTFTLISSMVR